MSKTFDDFEIGKSFKTSAITITEAHVVTFAGLSGDNHPIQMDAEYAKNSIFGARIAHGLLVFSVAAGLVLQSGYLADAIISFIGIKDLKFLRPVMIGDTIHVLGSVSNKVESSKGDKGILTVTYEIKNQREDLVIEANLDFLMRKIV